MIQQRSETGVENGIFWSEIGSGFEEPGGTPFQEFRGVPPPLLPRAKILQYLTKRFHFAMRLYPGITQNTDRRRSL